MNQTPPPTSPKNDDKPIIRLVDLYKSFETLTVLKGVSLDFYAGQTTVILGPSGTGKSVLLKHIVGLLKPDQGEVWVQNDRVDQSSDAQLVKIRTNFGYLFQMGALFDSMTVYDNICFPLREHTKLPTSEMSKRCAKVLRIVGMEGSQTKMPVELSGGQRKRVALARAIVLEPKVVLYDEPTTGLDPIRSDVINELIINLSKKLNITNIVVTHDMVSAKKIADRMVMLYDGVIVEDANPVDFLKSEKKWVQQFIQGQADPEDLELIQRGFDESST